MINDICLLLPLCKAKKIICLNISFLKYACRYSTPFIQKHIKNILMSIVFHFY